MLFHPSADQRELIDEAFSRPLDDLLPIARLHAKTSEPWDDLAALGLFGVAAPEEIGGVGLGPAEEALLGIALGRKLADPRILATLMAQHLADDATRAALASGETRAALAYLTPDGQVCAIDPAGADWLVVRHDGEATLVAADALAGATPLDETHWTLPLVAGSIDLAAAAWAPAPALLRIRLIEAAALAGIAATATAMAVDYAKVREQFGHPIGGFQAVKHHCANMEMAALAARDLVTFAAVALAEERADAAFEVEAALLTAIDGALLATRKSIQVHGGMGFSEEADPHLALKRAQLLVEASGGAERAAERVAAAPSPLHQ